MDLLQPVGIKSADQNSLDPFSFGKLNGSDPPGGVFQLFQEFLSLDTGDGKSGIHSGGAPGSCATVPSRVDGRHSGPENRGWGRLPWARSTAVCHSPCCVSPPVFLLSANWAPNREPAETGPHSG